MNNPIEPGLFRYLLPQGSTTYNTGLSYQYVDRLSSHQFYLYYNILRDCNIATEDMIEWFFTQYLPREFGANGFRIIMPSSNSRYFEKCRTVLPEIESILKQFNLYINDGKIDHELMQIASNPLPLSHCSSFLQNKYIYPNTDESQEYRNVVHLLFSDQCMLKYLKRAKRNYRHFTELILSETVRYNDYSDYLHSSLDWLQRHGYIALRNDSLCFSNINQVQVLFDLHKNQTINYWRCSPQLRTEIDKLIQKRLLKAGNSLFSAPEQDYFDYHLNRRTFSNSLDLRNKYLHGTQPDPEDDKQHEANYMIILKLLILIIIKINDEFCLHDDKKKGNPSHPYMTLPYE